MSEEGPEKGQTWKKESKFDFEKFVSENLASISPDHAVDPDNPVEIKSGLEEQEIINKLGRVSFWSPRMTKGQVREAILTIDKLVPNQRESIKKGMEENKAVFGVHLSIFEKEGGEAK